MSDRIQKVLAQAGIGSRRQIETWIKAGRIKINNQVAIIGMPVELPAKIEVNGRVLRLNKPPTLSRRILLYHKPEGEICTRSDPQGRATVFENLPSIHNGRWISVGRLDINSSGLMLFTNDGELATRLMHPKQQIEREYAVRVLGKVDEHLLKRLKRGVRLEDGMARFNEIIDAGGTGANHWYHVILLEGRKREVRRLWESQGVKVSRLIRVRFGDIRLPRYLARGRYQELAPKDVEVIAANVGL